MTRSNRVRGVAFAWVILLPLALYLGGCSKEKKEGACCDTDGACSMTTESACHGVFHGTGSVCVGDRCPMGACCDGQACEVKLPERCNDPSSYLGDGTTCDASSCATAVTGACCATDGTCSVTEPGSCTGTDTFQGADTSCSPNPCTAQPTGACCDDSNQCTDDTQADCGAAGHRFLGASTSCDATPGENPCLTAGACCLGGGGCNYASDEQDCLVVGGTFQGVGSACDGTCPPPKVEWVNPSQNVMEDVGQVTIDAHLSGPWPAPITAPFTVGGTATNPADHNLGLGSLLFQAGHLTAGVSFNVVDDSVVENAETVIATLSAPTDGSYALGTQTAHTVTIQDNDGAPTVQWSTAAQNVDEDVGQVNVTVQISAAQSVDVIVSYTVAGTATNPDDHNAATGQVTIPAGSTSAGVQFNVVDDSVQEGDETVIFTITGATGAGATPGAQTVHTVTIQDNDGPVTITPQHAPEGICRTYTNTARIFYFSLDDGYGWWNFLTSAHSSQTAFSGFKDGSVNFNDTAVFYWPDTGTVQLSSLTASLAMGGAMGLFATGAAWGAVTGVLQDLWTVGGGTSVTVYRQYDTSQFPPQAASQDTYSLPTGAVAQLITWIPGVQSALVRDPAAGTMYLVSNSGVVLYTLTGLGWLTRGEGADRFYLGVSNDGDHGGNPILSNVFLYDAATNTVIHTWTHPNNTGDFRSASLDKDTTQLVGAAVAADGYFVIVVDIASGASCATWVPHAASLLDVVVVYSQNALVLATSAGTLEKWPLSPLLCTP